MPLFCECPAPAPVLFSIQLGTTSTPYIKRVRRPREREGAQAQGGISSYCSSCIPMPYRNIAPENCFVRKKPWPIPRSQTLIIGLDGTENYALPPVAGTLCRHVT
jgi:hypothetical protein